MSPILVIFICIIYIFIAGVCFAIMRKVFYHPFYETEDDILYVSLTIFWPVLLSFFLLAMIYPILVNKKIKKKIDRRNATIF